MSAFIQHVVAHIKSRCVIKSCRRVKLFSWHSKNCTRTKALVHFYPAIRTNNTSDMFYYQIKPMHGSILLCVHIKGLQLTVLWFPIGGTSPSHIEWNKYQLISHETKIPGCMHTMLFLWGKEPYNNIKIDKSRTLRHLLNKEGYFFSLTPYASGVIPGLRPANERRRYFVTTSLIGWTQTQNHPCACCALWLMWHYSHRRVNMMVSDGLAPIWSQNICNRGDNSTTPGNVKTVLLNEYIPMDADSDWTLWTCGLTND